MDQMNLPSFNYFSKNQFSRIGAIGFLSIALSLTILRSGLRFTSNLDTFRETVPNFFNSFYYWRSSIVVPLFANVLDLETRTSWLIGYGVVTTLLLVGPLFFYWISPNPQNLVVGISILISQIPVIALTEFGRFDVFVLFGSLIMGLSSKHLTFFVGAILVSISNYEHFIPIAISVLIILQVTDSQLRPSKVAAILFAVGVVVSIIHQVVFGQFLLFAFGADSRASWLVDNISKFTIANLVSLPLLIFSTYGSLWIVVIVGILISSDVKTKIFQISALFTIPFIFTLVTFDGTRVFVSLSSTSLIIFLRSFVAKCKPTKHDARSYAIFLLALAAITPAMNVSVLGNTKQPYLDVVERLFGLNGY